MQEQLYHVGSYVFLVFFYFPLSPIFLFVQFVFLTPAYMGNDGLLCVLWWRKKKLHKNKDFS